MYFKILTAHSTVNYVIWYTELLFSQLEYVLKDLLVYNGFLNYIFITGDKEMLCV